MEKIASSKVHWLRQQVDRGKAKKKKNRGRMHKDDNEVISRKEAATKQPCKEIFFFGKGGKGDKTCER